MNSELFFVCIAYNPQPMTSPLHHLHESAGAEFQDYAGTSIVLTFGQLPAEYSAIRKSAAIIDFPQRACLELTGPDRLPFLNNLLTNETWNKDTKTGIPAGTAVYSFLLNTKGRILSDLYVIELGDRTLIEADARQIELVRQFLGKYIFREKVGIAGRSGGLWKLFLTGPRAFDALLKASGANMGAPAELGALSLTIAGANVVVYRDDFCGVPGYALIVPAESVEGVWRTFTREPRIPGGEPSSDDRLVSGGQECPPLDQARQTGMSVPPEPTGTSVQPEQFLKFTGLARRGGWAAFNTVRIEAGRPIFGIDYDESVLPAETGQLNRAVSFTKGCYLGQEIVARMHAREQVSRLIVGIRMDADALPVAGVKIHDAAGNEVGGITSSTVSPVLSRAAICLGIVRRAHAAMGARLHIPAEGAMHTGTVVDLPFVR
ncbi:MAG: glycine cleavage T C-terminal barrel domain-containing protein [Tepidisphaerales bacterium]